ncbi:hypothetical protein [Ciceribacter selenitireducens]|uniref:Uncharacterized protein n=1 Tax=Ciceribacter selenitireducens ATCC BAA-1503 TaxID=1336235 RepID=A0A376AHB7_9HYPH|nr:hypothetical protein [Ciceribacter selenitireducens]SSC67067.1 unnamed protein product [Ciceribacter selenitireducens ATCC BAA-1503]
MNKGRASIARGFGHGSNAWMAALLHFLAQTPSPRRWPTNPRSENFGRLSADICKRQWWRAWSFARNRDVLDRVFGWQAWSDGVNDKLHFVTA